MSKDSARASVFVSDSTGSREERGGEAEKMSSKMSFVVVTLLTAVVGIVMGAGEDENKDWLSRNIPRRLDLVMIGAQVDLDARSRCSGAKPE